MKGTAPPIIVFADVLYAFESVEEMLEYIEPIDVGEVRAVFDSEGRSLLLRTEGVKTRGFWVGGGALWVEHVGSPVDVVELDTMLRDELSNRYRSSGFTTDVVVSLNHSDLIDAAVRLTR